MLLRGCGDVKDVLRLVWHVFYTPLAKIFSGTAFVELHSSFYFGFFQVQHARLAFCLEQRYIFFGVGWHKH